tara:strand:- start:5077 stop:5286 length:210 start_codon:yes stop_codon:yes gene_type:complete
MRVGDLVKIKAKITIDKVWCTDIKSQIGIILDEYEDMTTMYYKVHFAHEQGWFDEFELELVNNSYAGAK